LSAAGSEEVNAGRLGRAVPARRVPREAEVNAGVEVAGEQLARARAGRHLIDPLPDRLLADLASAYRVQRAAVAALAGPTVGWKLGATAGPVQRLLRLQAPFHAPLIAGECYPSGARIGLAPGTRGVEVELAFRLARDLPARKEGYPPEAILPALGSLHPALEVVGTREARALLDGLHAIADFGLNIAFVHGPAIAGWRGLDLAGVGARCVVDGVEAARGTSAVVLGSPLLALAWLTRQGVALRAGDWISTGSITGITPLHPAARVVGDFGPLGRVELRVAA
jgi:2-keto-4-pentenoate hydratase